MTEARRATIALATLVTLAAGAGVLLAFYLPHLLEPHLRTIAWYCRLPGVALASSQGPVTPWSAWLSFGLLLAGAVFAFGRLGRTVWGARRIGRLLAVVPGAALSSGAAQRVASRAAAMRLPTAPLVADFDGRPAAFTIGLVRSRIVVSSAVVEALTDAEFDAILLHEAAHMRRRDPLRLLVAGFCRDFLFFLPLSHTLFGVVREAQERAADDVAAEAAGPLEVASALIAFLRVAGRRPALAIAPAAAGADPEARIRRLLDAPVSKAPRRGYLSRTGATLVISGVLLMGLGGMPATAAGTWLASCCAVAAPTAGVMGPPC
jgi:hypothetical protein